jgi:hypothetical protein
LLVGGLKVSLIKQLDPKLFNAVLIYSIKYSSAYSQEQGVWLSFVKL